MKNTCLIILSVLFVVGCGGGKKNPFSDNELKSIRDEAKTAEEMGPQKPQVKTNTVIVEKEIEVIREESSIDKILVISPDPEMSFNEGQVSNYKIRARALKPGVQIELIATDLPSGATLTKSPVEKDLYILSWKPAYYIIPTSSNMKTYEVKLTAKVISTDKSEDLAKYKDIVRENTVSLFVFKNQIPPNNLKVQGLPAEINEGTETSFKVTVNVPGVDDKAPTPPILVVRYDGVASSAGNNFLESDATRHLVIKDTKYLGNDNWEFSFVFDTKKIPAAQQLAKDGSVMANADGIRTRMSFKVYNGIGLSTPETLFQLKIKYAKKDSTQAARK